MHKRSRHIGNCLKLIQALRQLMPEKRVRFEEEEHVMGTNNECFKDCVAKLVVNAITENHLTLEYARACKYITDIFEPRPPGSANAVNIFQYFLRNECQRHFENNTKKQVFKNSQHEYLQYHQKFNMQTDAQRRYDIQMEWSIILMMRQIAVGTIRFIGELFNVEVLDVKIMEYCLNSILQSHNEINELFAEFFHTLISIIGAKLESQVDGHQIIGRCVGVLRDIYRSRLNDFSMRACYMIADADARYKNNCWEPVRLNNIENQSEITIERSPSVSSIEEANRILFRDFNEFLKKSDAHEKMSFTYRFDELKINTEARMRGIVKIVFENIVSDESESKPFFAIFCKGLSRYSVPNDDKTKLITFKDFLFRLVQREVDAHILKATIFRHLNDRINILRAEKDINVAKQMKISLDKDIKLRLRSISIMNFVGELYIVDLIESRTIAKYLVMFLMPEVINNVSVECFCNLIAIIGSKIMKENSCDGFIKDSLIKLYLILSSGNPSSRVRELINETLTIGRMQWKLLPEIRKDESNFHVDAYSPWTTAMKLEKLWQSTVVKKKKLEEVHRPSPEITSKQTDVECCPPKKK